MNKDSQDMTPCFSLGVYSRTGEKLHATNNFNVEYKLEKQLKLCGSSELREIVCGGGGYGITGRI